MRNNGKLCISMMQIKNIHKSIIFNNLDNCLKKSLELKKKKLILATWHVVVAEHMMYAYFFIGIGITCVFIGFHFKSFPIPMNCLIQTHPVLMVRFRKLILIYPAAQTKHIREMVFFLKHIY